MPPKSTRRNPAPGPTRPGAGGTRVAIVTRISTDEVNQPYSLEAQATGLEAFVASQPGQAITHRFVDQASGATLERPGLQAALASAKAGEFDVLLVYRIDRISRSIVGLMTIVEALDAAGVALRSATEPIDTHGPVGRMLLQLLGIFAEFERSLLIDRITKGFERKAARGEWFAGPGPFGYRLEPATKTLAAEPAEAAVVQAMSPPTSTSASAPPPWPSGSTTPASATGAASCGATRQCCGCCATPSTSARSPTATTSTKASTTPSSTPASTPGSRPSSNSVPPSPPPPPRRCRSTS
jgi:DNA invertase Pin-like site-specific DNA recombinase